MCDPLRRRPRTPDGAGRARVATAARRGGAASRRASAGCSPSPVDSRWGDRTSSQRPDRASEASRGQAPTATDPGMAFAQLRFLQRGMTVRLQLTLMLAFLVNGPAGADELERSLPVACAASAELAPPALADASDGAGHACDASFARALDARVDDVLERSVALASERARALLESRASGPDVVARSAARVQRQLDSASAREVARHRREGAVPPLQVVVYAHGREVAQN